MLAERNLALLMTMRTFSPPARTLMGPGPSDVHPRVLGAHSRPTSAIWIHNS
jgi:aspartate aminotransferase-like enzyme